MTNTVFHICRSKKKNNAALSAVYIFTFAELAYYNLHKCKKKYTFTYMYTTYYVYIKEIISLLLKLIMNNVIQRKYKQTFIASKG